MKWFLWKIGLWENSFEGLLALSRAICWLMKKHNNYKLHEKDCVYIDDLFIISEFLEKELNLLTKVTSQIWMSCYYFLAWPYRIPNIPLYSHVFYLSSSTFWPAGKKIFSSTRSYPERHSMTLKTNNQEYQYSEIQRVPVFAQFN